MPAFGKSECILRENRRQMERELIGWFFTAREPISWEAEAASRRQEASVTFRNKWCGFPQAAIWSSEEITKLHFPLGAVGRRMCALGDFGCTEMHLSLLCSHSHFLLEMQHMFELRRPPQCAHLRPPDPASKQGRGVGATPGGGKLR